MRPVRQRVSRPGRDGGRFRHRGPAGAVLLEVIIALSLFVFAAAVISSGLSTAVDRVARLHAQAHALDLAASVLAEVEIGLRPAQNAGPEPFEAPFEAWTWQVEAVPFAFGEGEAAGLQRVTAIVRHASEPVVQRLTQLLPDAVAPGTGLVGGAP